jgi:hypothetical protein
MIHHEIFFKKNIVDCGGTKKNDGTFLHMFRIFLERQNSETKKIFTVDETRCEEKTL